MKPSASKGVELTTKWTAVILFLIAVLLIFFYRSFLPGQVLFSNDGPLGRISAEYHALPASFTGVWNDLNSVGYREQGALTSISYGLRWGLGNVPFSKFYIPFGLLVAGLGAWCFFRQCGLAGPACVLGALATTLNMDFFSTACWGIAAVPITVGMTFFALAALMKTNGWRGWVRTALAGLAVGMGVAEGADVGAIFSIFVAAYLVYEGWIAEGPLGSRAILTAGRLVVVVSFAVLLAAQPISALFSTQIKDVAGLDETIQTPAEHWDWATQWSLPKREALSLVVPGLFGYRMDTPNGASYWGDVGRAPSWERYYANGQQGTPPKGLKRFMGSGIYCGTSVVLLAVWAALQSLVRQHSVFDRLGRRRLWFWMVVLFVSLLLGFGRYAPFYRFLYHLPFFSTIRNPIKFIEVVNFCLLILFGFAADGIWRRYLLRPEGGPALPPNVIQFDRRWMLGCLLVFVGSLVAWGVYANYRQNVEGYLLGESYSEPLARAVSAFSVAQVGWFVLFFAVMAGLTAFILQGGLRGKNALWGAGLLGICVFLDLANADWRWVNYWDYPDKYANNPVLEMLEKEPYEHRVTIPPYRMGNAQDPFTDLYRLEWMQQQFPYRNIQALDLVQLPRTPRDLKEFMETLKFDGSSNTFQRLVRRFELTNTRYIMAATSYGDFFNDKFDPERKSLRTLARFNLVPKRFSTSTGRFERITAELAPDGNYAVFEFQSALPRAKLYTNWEIVTNEPACLARLADPNFVPASDVLVSEKIPAPPVATAASPGVSGVAIASYEPKKVVLNATNTTAAVLLLNDRFDRNWHVTVDGKAAPVLQCNYLMRGVYLEPGTHVVEYQFRPAVKALYVSLVGMGVGILMLGVISFSGEAEKESLPEPAEVPPVPAPAPPPVAAISKKARRRLEKTKR